MYPKTSKCGCTTSYKSSSSFMQSLKSCRKWLLPTFTLIWKVKSLSECSGNSFTVNKKARALMWERNWLVLFFKNHLQHANIEVSLSVDWIFKGKKFSFNGCGLSDVNYPLGVKTERSRFWHSRYPSTCNMSHDLVFLPGSSIVCTHDMRGWRESRICIHKFLYCRGENCIEVRNVFY